VSVSFPKQLPAGGEGKITIKVDTAGYGGKPVKKNMVVHTSEISNKRINLTVSGFVEKFATVNPEKVFLNGPLETNLSATLEIIPEEKYPFKILETSMIYGNNIIVNLEKNPGSKSSRYLLTVKSTAKVKGRYFDSITLKTDSKLRPEIKIPVIVNIS